MLDICSLNDNQLASLRKEITESIQTNFHGVDTLHVS